MPVGIWPVNKAIVEDSQELVRYLDALRTWILSLTGGGGTPGAPNQSVQFNNAGTFGGDANLLWDSGSVSLIFGPSGRIIADTSNATQSIRFWFNNSVVNQNTNFGIKPNGTATSAFVRAVNNSDPTAALNLGQFGQANTITVVDATVLNAGTQGTLELRIASVTALQIDDTKNAQFKAGVQRPVVSKTANYTIVETDDVIFADASGGSFTLTLPAANIAGAGFTPTYKIKRIDSSANTVTVARAGGDTIDGGTTYVLGALQAVEMQSDGVSAWGAF